MYVVPDQKFGYYDDDEDEDECIVYFGEPRMGRGARGRTKDWRVPQGGETVVAKARVVYPGWPTQWCLPRRTAAYGRTVWPRGRLVAR